MNHITILHTTYEVKGTTSSWPNKNNCYKVEVTNHVANTTHIAEYMSIAEYDLIMSIQRIASKISIEELEDLLQKIETVKEEQYLEGSYNDENK